ncbi:hypothetical protein [Actinomadura rubrobrunea]|uniref:hypothetical protein n=1 Tax=Actinomadura rubrobrunea TaxID=115335 RepID=UPI001471B08D|nr:hypothetical protein [Actinomadura rubrobrunea]
MTETSATSARLLRPLALLQTRREWSGPELAERLADLAGRLQRAAAPALRQGPAPGEGTEPSP